MEAIPAFILYRFYKDFISVKFGADIPERCMWLPRFGVSFGLNNDFNKVFYFGRGAGEAYVDRHFACPIGLYCAEAKDMFINYPKPQENGSHCDSRFVGLHGLSGSINVTSEQAFSFCVSPYEATEFTPHAYEMRHSEDVNLYIDYMMSGVGSASCGPELAEKYRMNEKHPRLAFEISFVSPEKLYKEK